MLITVIYLHRSQDGCRGEGGGGQDVPYHPKSVGEFIEKRSISRAEH